MQRGSEAGVAIRARVSDKRFTLERLLVDREPVKTEFAEATNHPLRSRSRAGKYLCLSGFSIILLSGSYLAFFGLPGRLSERNLEWPMIIRGSVFVLGALYALALIAMELRGRSIPLDKSTSPLLVPGGIHMVIMYIEKSDLMGLFLGIACVVMGLYGIRGMIRRMRFGARKSDSDQSGSL